MKKINKVMLFIFTCLTFSHVPTHCFYYNNGYPNNAFNGALIGGLAGGGRGAAIGLGVGMSADMIGAAAANDRRRREDEYRYAQQRKAHNKYRSQKEEIRDLRNKTTRLEERLARYENQQQTQE